MMAGTMVMITRITTAGDATSATKCISNRVYLVLLDLTC
jgi:hypothetical protein